MKKNTANESGSSVNKLMHSEFQTHIFRHIYNVNQRPKTKNFTIVNCAHAGWPVYISIFMALKCRTMVLLPPPSMTNSSSCSL